MGLEFRGLWPMAGRGFIQHITFHYSGRTRPEVTALRHPTQKSLRGCRGRCPKTLNRLDLSEWLLKCSYFVRVIEENTVIGGGN